MKVLSLLRHAEAEQTAGVRDFDRGLSSYGAQMAPRLGRRLEQKNFMPQLIVASPAVRTMETAHIMCYELGYPVESMELHDDIYRASLESLLQIIRQLNESIDHVMLVGHNPALSELATYLCSSTVVRPVEKSVPSYMATCALLQIQLSVEYWALVDASVGIFVEYDTPENVS